MLLDPSGLATPPIPLAFARSVVELVYVLPGIVAWFSLGEFVEPSYAHYWFFGREFSQQAKRVPKLPGPSAGLLRYWPTLCMYSSLGNHLSLGSYDVLEGTPDSAWV